VQSTCKCARSPGLFFVPWYSEVTSECMQISSSSKSCYCGEFRFYQYYGYAVVQLVEALCYKPKSRGFESRWGEFFSIYLILPAAIWFCGRLNIWQKWIPGIFLGGKGRQVHKADNLTAHHLWANCLEKVWEPRHLTTLWALMACYRDSFTFYLYYG
jgi:hypothetical protein